MDLNCLVNAVRINDRMIEISDTMKGLFADSYAEKMQTYKGFIASARRKFNADTLPATLAIIKDLESEGKCSPIIVSLLIAAAVETIEQEGRKS